MDMRMIVCRDMVRCLTNKILTFLPTSCILYTCNYCIENNKRFFLPEDKEHELVGPKPTTFSGMRALNFVLDNPRVDRTLLFNVKLIRVDRGDGKGGFIRG